MTFDQTNAATSIAFLLLKSGVPADRKFTDKEIESAVVYACTAAVNLDTILHRTDPHDGEWTNRVEDSERKSIEFYVKTFLEARPDLTPELKWSPAAP